MSILGNIIWFVFGGVLIFLEYIVSGLLMCVTIIGIPFGVQCFKRSLLGLTTLLVVVVGGVSAAEPVRIELFPVGIYGDDARAVTCVTGPPGTVFQQGAWVNVPNDLGLAYVTLRFDFPTNVDLTSRPVFHDLVNNVVFTDFVDGSVEWNMLFDDCPSGWIKIFTQDCVILDDEMSRIRVIGSHSLVRDCTFVLNDVNVLNQLSINDPDCQNVPAIPTGWGGVKCGYR